MPRPARFCRFATLALRRRADALRAERARLRSIVDSIPGVVWEAWGQPDRASQHIDFVSDHVTRMLGYTVDEWLSTPNFWLTIVHPDDRERAAETARLHFAAGGTSKNEFRWVTKYGRALWVSSTSTVVQDGEGRAVGMRGVTMDDDARHRAEERLRFLFRAAQTLGTSLDYQTTLRELVRLAVPYLGDFCVIDVIGEDGTRRRLAIAAADPALQPVAEELLRYPPTAESKSMANEVFRTGEPAVIARLTDAIIADRSSDDAHQTLIRSLGIASVLAVPMRAHGRTLGAITFLSRTPDRYTPEDRELAMQLANRAGLAADNAQLHRAALNASRAKDDFLATISHELRTPMTATLGWLRMLELGYAEGDVRQVALESIGRSTRAQAKLIDDILDVSSIITGKFRLDVAPLELPRIIDETIATLRPAATAREIVIDVDTGGWSPALRGDANRLQQVVWNLVSNAIKFERHGGHIEVRLARAGESARLTVTDDGSGIDPAFLPHVFDRFRQQEGGLTRTHGGLGLGLAIVRHLVELHGGTVRAASEGAGHGATLTIDLPLVTAAEETKANVMTAAPLPRLDRQRILVVDDDDGTLQYIAAVLRQCGATVTTALSADEAMVALNGGGSERTHDLVVTDVAMPRQDAFALARRMAAAGATQPLIALTGASDVALHPHAASFARIIRKPVDPVELAREVASVVRQ